MLLQFCHYHIQNYRSHKQGEQEANLRTNQNSSGGSGRRQGGAAGGGLLLLALRFNPSHPTVLLAEFHTSPRCRLEGGDAELKEQGYLGSSSVLMQELLPSLRQVSSSNYLRWVPPRAKLSRWVLFPDHPLSYLKKALQ